MQYPRHPSHPSAMATSYSYGFGDIPKERFSDALPDVEREPEIEQEKAIVDCEGDRSHRVSAVKDSSKDSSWESSFVLMMLAAAVCISSVTLSVITYQLIDSQQPALHKLGTLTTWKL